MVEGLGREGPGSALTLRLLNRVGCGGRDLRILSCGTEGEGVSKRVDGRVSGLRYLS